MINNRLQITILVDNPKSWYCSYAERLAARLSKAHHVAYVHDSSEIPAGDCAFLLSCSRLIRSEVLQRNRHNIVVHSSSLPAGRGFAPLTWQILEGRSVITNTMFEAADAVDAGPIYATNQMEFEGHELVDELRVIQAGKVGELVEKFVAEYPHLTPRPQAGEASSYPRRRNSDSELDIYKSLAEQFDLLRVVDNESYPAFFHHRGHKYILKIYKDTPAPAPPTVKPLPALEEVTA